MFIETERLALRSMTMDDAENMYGYASDVENTKHMVFFPHTDIRQTRDFVEKIITEYDAESPDFYELAVCLKGRMIGHVSLYMVEDGGELAWIIDKKYWGRGFAAEAARAMIGFGREKLGINKFCAMCDHRNDASRRVMEKLGMKKEAEGVRPYTENGRPVKEYIYSITY
jgi:ribosomal-protein-alanine N-acetyltransferase